MTDIAKSANMYVNMHAFFLNEITGICSAKAGIRCFLVDGSNYKSNSL